MLGAVSGCHSCSRAAETIFNWQLKAIPLPKGKKSCCVSWMSLYSTRGALGWIVSRISCLMNVLLHLSLSPYAITQLLELPCLLIMMPCSSFVGEKSCHILLPVNHQTWISGNKGCALWPIHTWQKLKCEFGAAVRPGGNDSKKEHLQLWKKRKGWLLFFLD